VDYWGLSRQKQTNSDPRTVGTRSFSGVIRPGCGVDHPTPSSAKVKERVELYVYSPSRSS